MKRFLKKNYEQNIKKIEKLKSEITTLRGLNHKNIVKLKEIFETENSVYLIFEHLEGEKLVL